MAIQFTTNDLYSKIKETYSYTGSVQKKVLEVDTNVQKLKEDMEEFQKNVKDLKKFSNRLTTKSKLEKQLKKFIKSYNTMKKNSESITKEKLNSQLSELDEYINSNKKSLEKIGVKISEGVLNFDNDIFDESNDKDIESLFVGKDSFIAQVNKFMRSMEKTADDAEYDTVTRKINKTTHYDKEQLDFVHSLNVFDGTVYQLVNTSQNIQSSTSINEEQKETVIQYLTNFKDKYNEALKKSSVVTNDNLNSSFEGLKELFKANEGNLSSIGLYLNNDDTMDFIIADSELDKNNFKEAYTYLFKDDSSFANSISEYCKGAFQLIIKPDKIGVTIIDEYI